MTPEQAIHAWNAQADESNQWDELGEDEKLGWVIAQARAELIAELEPVAVAKVVYTHGGGVRLDICTLVGGQPELSADPRIVRSGVPLAIIPKE